jgi:hypothetical protein
MVSSADVEVTGPEFESPSDFSPRIYSSKIIS